MIYTMFGGGHQEGWLWELGRLIKNLAEGILICDNQLQVQEGSGWH